MRACQEHLGEALRDALSLDAPLRMDKLLKDSEGYGKDIHGPRSAVERLVLFYFYFLQTPL